MEELQGGEITEILKAMIVTGQCLIGLRVLLRFTIYTITHPSYIDD